MDRGVDAIHANYLFFLTRLGINPTLPETHTAPIETKPLIAPEPVTATPPSTTTYTTSPQTETPQHPALCLYNPVRRLPSTHRHPRQATATSPHYQARRLPSSSSVVSNSPPPHHPAQPPTPFSVVVVVLADRLERVRVVRGWRCARTPVVNSLL